MDGGFQWWKRREKSNKEIKHGGGWSISYGGLWF